MKKILFYSLILLWVFSACNKDNFDDMTSTTEEFTPIVRVLSYGTWEVGIDTLLSPMDSTIVEKDGTIGRFSGFWEYLADDLYVSELYDLKFITDNDDLDLEEGNYDLQSLQQAIFKQTLTGIDTVAFEIWEGNNISGSLEITTAEEIFDPIYNAWRIEISGFANGTLTDSNGTTHPFSSTFNKLLQ